MPVLMRLQWLDEARSFLGDVGRLAGQESGGLEDAVDAGGLQATTSASSIMKVMAAIAFQEVLAGGMPLEVGKGME